MDLKDSAVALGFRDKTGLLIEAFDFYGPVDLPSLIIASKILEIGIVRKPGFVVTREEALAAYYVAQKDRNEKIFGMLGSKIQEHPGVEDDDHPEFHSLVNRALVFLPPSEFDQRVDEIAGVASESGVHVSVHCLVEAQEKGLITLGCKTVHRCFDNDLSFK